MGNGEVKFSNLSPVMQGILVLLTILGMVVPATLGFVNFDKRLDMTEDTVGRHIEKDEIKWEKTDEEIDALKEKDHVIEMNQKETAINFSYILKELESLNQKLDNLEVMD